MIRSQKLKSLMAVAVCLLAVAAWVGSAGASMPVGSMTLRESDLPSAFSQDFSHAVPAIQVRVLQGSMLPRYLDAWQRAFTRVQGLKTTAVTSSVLRYGSPASAHQAFAQTWQQIAKRTGAKPFSVGVGSESRAFTYPKGPLAAYAVTWRYKNVNAIVLMVGLTSSPATQQFTKKLALKQQARMKAAAG
jgi:hypothetical protein